MFDKRTGCDSIIALDLRFDYKKILSYVDCIVKTLHVEPAFTVVG